MAGYFSEVGYQDAPPNFFEVAVPAGTDVSGYSIAIYDASGVLLTTMPFGPPDVTHFDPRFCSSKAHIYEIERRWAIPEVV